VSVTFDAGSGATDGSSTVSTRSWAHTVGAGSQRLLLVWVGIDAPRSTNVDSASWNNGSGAQALTKIGTWATPGSFPQSQIDLWALFGPNSGAGTVTAANSGGTIRATFEAQSFAGATSLGTVVTAQGTTSTNPSATASGVGSSDMIASAVCALGSSATLPTATGTSQTLDSAQAAGVGTKTISAVAHQPGTAGASSWTIPSQTDWIALAVPVLATGPAWRRPNITVKPRAVSRAAVI
jgi:hypothetical protein